jgi:hypothetical protein
MLVAVGMSAAVGMLVVVGMSAAGMSVVGFHTMCISVGRWEE